MKKIILTEKQNIALANLLNEEILNMPVPKKMNKPYCINPEKVKIVKRFLDNGFQKGTIENIGNNGFPQKIKIVAMMDSGGNVLKNMLMDEMVDLLIEKYKNMFSDQEERSLFMNQVLNDWFDNKINMFGHLSVNCLK